MIKRMLFSLALSVIYCLQTNAQAIKTSCNPVNISYRFGVDKPSRREAADPVVIRYKDGYLLFASKSGGYWYSGDLISWNFIQTNEIPTEDYAPTAVVIRDTVYLIARQKKLMRPFIKQPI